MHFETLVEDLMPRDGQHAAMIYGAQRVQSAAALRDQAVGPGAFGRVQQIAQEIGTEARHVARHNQAPIRLADFERRAQASQRSAVFVTIGGGHKPQRHIAFRSTDQRDAASRRADAPGHVFQQGPVAQRQNGLVPTHPRTTSPGQDESGPAWQRATWPSGFHEKILTVGLHGTRLVKLNKRVYICCLLGIAMLAASPMLAAELSAPSSLLAPSSNAGKVATVKVDRRTGKLVRVVTGPTGVRAVAVPAPPSRINELVERSAHAHQVDPLLVHSVIQVESNYNCLLY